MSPSKAAVPAQTFAPIAMGIQRGDALMVRLFHDGSLKPEDAVLRLSYTNGRFGNIVANMNSRTGGPLDAPEALLRGHKRGSGLGPHHIDFVFAPKPNKLVQSAFVKIRQGDGYATVPWAKGFGFSVRIPQDAEAFKDHLTFKRRRHSDEETVFASSFDVLRAFVGTPEAARLAPYLINAFVICTYKTVTTAAAVNPAMAYFNDIDALIDTLGPSPSMRLDREIARLSVHTALWHYAVHIDDRDLFQASMEGIEAVSRIEREQHPTFAYNACKSLLLHGAIMSFDEPRRARHVFALVYTRFRAAAAVRTSNPTWLTELAVALEASILALSAMRFIRHDIELTRGNVRSILEMAPRVDTPDFTKKLKAMVVARKTAGKAKLKAAPTGKAAAEDEPDLDDEIEADED